MNIEEDFYDINYHEKTVGYLDITFGPKWDYIPITRNYVENFLSIHTSNQEDISKVEMIASELLENGVKYSNHDGVRMIIKKDEDRKVIELAVYNYCTKESAEKIIMKIEEANKHDPIEYYLKCIQESKENKEKNGSAGLGVARINYEGNAKLSGRYNEKKSILEIKAEVGYVF